MSRIGTYNEEGEMVDLYIPRKCHASHQLITAKDHASVQITIADIDADGTYNGDSTTFCIAGLLRNQSASDHAINRLCITNGIIRPKTGSKTKKVKDAEKEAALVTRQLIAKANIKAKRALVGGRGRGGRGGLRGAGGRGRGEGRGGAGRGAGGRGRGEGRGAGRGRGSAKKE